MSEEKENPSIRLAKAITGNISSAALALKLFHDDADINAMSDKFKELSLNVIDNNDPRLIEEMLLVQGKMLGIIFNEMVSRASCAQSMEGLKSFMDIGLRAQNQSRNTILALQSIKNQPQQIHIEQQNVALAQQVNNGLSMVVKEVKARNELMGLEVKNEERLDFGKKEAAGAINPPLAAVETSWGANARRKGQKQLKLV